MGKRKIPLKKGEYFHIYNRGTDKRKIFLDSRDFGRFLLLLEYCNSDIPLGHINRVVDWNQDVFACRSQATTRLVTIECYCLLENHFHLLVKSEVDEGISIFMQKVCTGYSKYFNKKYDRSGSLFQGKFKAEHVADDEYFYQLLAYVSCNYLVHGVSDSRKYRSSISFVFDQGHEFITQSEYIEQYFKNKLSFVDFAQNKVLETCAQRNKKDLLEE